MVEKQLDCNVEKIFTIRFFFSKSFSNNLVENIHALPAVTNIWQYGSVLCKSIPCLSLMCLHEAPRQEEQQQRPQEFKTEQNRC